MQFKNGLQINSYWHQSTNPVSYFALTAVVLARNSSIQELGDKDDLGLIIIYGPVVENMLDFLP
jgi:hypothetical protein